MDLFLVLIIFIIDIYSNKLHFEGWEEGVADRHQDPAVQVHDPACAWEGDTSYSGQYREAPPKRG